MFSCLLHISEVIFTKIGEKNQIHLTLYLHTFQPKSIFYAQWMVQTPHTPTLLSTSARRKQTSKLNWLQETSIKTNIINTKVSELYLTQHYEYLLESTQWCKDRTSDPNTVFAFRWSNHLDLHATWSKSSYFFTHSVCNSREHGRSTTEHNISIQIYSKFSRIKPSIPTFKILLYLILGNVMIRQIMQYLWEIDKP